jgi:small-conductance mechanosensitive channel
VLEVFRQKCKNAVTVVHVEEISIFPQQCLSLLVVSTLSGAVNSVKRFALVLILLVVLAAGTLLLYDFFIQTPINLPDFVDNSIRISVIVGFWLTVLFFIRRSKPVIAKHFGDQPATIVQLFLGSIAVLVMAFALMRVLGVAPESLLAGAGIASITVGLIVSTFVGNILSGALVFTTHRFRVGDEVMVNNIPAKITELTTMATKMRTDIGHIAIPNSAIASGAVIITRIHSRESLSQSRLPYAQGDRVVTTYMAGEGTVTEITPIHTRVLLDSGRELLFLNSSVLAGSVAVGKITQPNLAAGQ